MKVFLTLIALLFATLVVKGQTVMELKDFSKYVGKNYVVAPELKTNCEWMYAIVKVRTDTLNKVVKYDFVNAPSKAIRDGFKNLIGYRFADSLKVTVNQTIAFYFAIENNRNCNDSDKSKVYYSPQYIINTLTPFYLKLIKDEPNCIVIPGALTLELGKAEN